MTRKPQTPSIRHHKPSGRAVVSLDGLDHYVGECGSEATQAAYDRLIAEWLANGRQLAKRNDLSVNELLVVYLHHAREFYGTRRTCQSQLSRIKVAIRPLEFQAVRQQFVDGGFCRSRVNDNIRDAAIRRRAC